MAGRGRPSVEDKRDNQYRVRLNDEEEQMLTYCSQTTGKPKSQIFREALVSYFHTVALNELSAQPDYGEMELSGISMKRVIECPYCGCKNMIDLSDFETSQTSSERPMGSDILHEFWCEEYECSGCNRAFEVKGYISEYPLGAYEHEEINIKGV